MKKEIFIGVLLAVIALFLISFVPAPSNNSNQTGSNQTTACVNDNDCEDNYDCTNNVCILEDKDNDTEVKDIKICCLRTMIKENESYKKYNYMGQKDCLEFNRFEDKINKTGVIVNDSLCQERKINKTEEKEEVRERQKLKFENKTGIECPNDCICTGVTMKCILEDGSREMKVYSSSGNLIIQVKDTNISTTVTLYKDENGTLYTDINGKEKKIKVYPDQVKEKIKANLEDEEFKIDENGNYDINAKKQARLFWMVPVREKVRVHVDPETGDTITTKTSWWGFLANDK